MKPAEELPPPAGGLKVGERRKRCIESEKIRKGITMTDEKKKELEALCLEFRKCLIETLHSIQTGHPGGSLSVCEILTTLYFNEANISPENIDDPNRDKIILCKGHAAPMLHSRFLRLIRFL